MVKVCETDRLCREPLKNWFDPRLLCGPCLFMRNNQAVKELISLDHPGGFVVSPDIDHITFP